MEDRKGVFEVLDEIELLEFFGTTAVERDVDDGYWCYESTDARGVTLRLSFNMYERSVQTELRLGGNVIANVSHEGAVGMRRDGSVLRFDFQTSGTKATLSVELDDAVRVDWATLRT